MSDGDLGLYVYCIVPAGAEVPVEGAIGVDPEFPLRLITFELLAAVVSRVRLTEFGTEALKRNLEDLGWLERTALAHDAVLSGILGTGALVPLRLLTIFSDEQHLLAMLDRQQDFLLNALERLRGHAEWSVKMLADPHALQAQARERGRETASVGAAARSEGSAAASVGGGPPAHESGRAFFERKKQDRTVRERARQLAEEAARETHAAVRQHAADTRLLPAQHPDLSRRSGEMVLNGAYLVEAARTEGFVAEADRMAERYRGGGIQIEVGGPWAPYNFVSDVAEGETTEDPA
jgi:hypothetical protein